MLSPWIHAGSVSVRHVYYRVAQVRACMCARVCVSAAPAISPSDSSAVGANPALLYAHPPPPQHTHTNTHTHTHTHTHTQKHAEWAEAVPERGGSCLDFVQQLGYREYSRCVCACACVRVRVCVCLCGCNQWL